MPSTTLRFNFYQVTMPGERSFEHHLKLIRDRGVPATRVRVIHGHTIRLQHWRKHGEYFLGEVVRVKKEDIPPSYDDNIDDPEDLALEKTKGLGFENAFLYYPAARALIYQANQNGVHHSRAMEFFQDFFASSVTDRLIKLDWMQNPDEIERRLKGIGVCRMLDFSVAVPADAEGIDTPGTAERAFLDAAKELRAPFLNVQLTMGTEVDRNASLNISVVKRLFWWARGLWQKDKESVRRFRINARDADEDRLNPMDLLEARMKEEYNTECEGQTMPQNDRLSAVRTVFEQWKSKIDTYYREKK